MKRILIVDDEPFFLTFLKKIFEKEGYRVDTTDNYEELEQYIQLKPHIILLDILIPGTNGASICRKLKNANETKDIAILLFSASSNIASIVKESKADGYIAKPFDIDQLVARVNTLVASGV